MFDVGIQGFLAADAFGYALTIQRTLTPVAALGTLSEGIRSVTGTNLPGAGFWYSFTLGFESNVAFDTLGSAIANMELALFDGVGNTVGGNDDAFATNNQARISGLLAPGTYYLALGSFALGFGAEGEEFAVEEGSFYNWDELLQAPAGWDRDGFNSSPIGGGHRLNLSVAAIPEPSTLALLGIGGLSLLWRRRPFVCR